MNKKYCTLLTALFSACLATSGISRSEESGVTLLAELTQNDAGKHDDVPEILRQNTTHRATSIKPSVPKTLTRQQDEDDSLPELLRSMTTDVQPEPPAQTKKTPARKSKATSSTARRAKSQPAPVQQQPAIPQEAWQWPLKGNIVERFSSIGYSKGIGIYGVPRQPVYAAKSGTVIYVGKLSSYGELVIIQNHDNNQRYVCTYANLEAIQVKKGDNIRQGQTIANLSINREKQPTLFFAVNYAGEPVDPLRYLPSLP